MKIRGARVNNLKNISCSVPEGKITVITGLSGSGKSSLAFDTIFAEGQRRYVDCLSTYARQFIEKMQKPDVEEITEIQPAIAVEQKNNVRNSRSTVGSLSEINDHLKLLFARCGTIVCPQCNVNAWKLSPQSLTDYLISRYKGKKAVSFIPLSANLFNDIEILLTSVEGKGFFRVIVDGEIKRIDEIDRSTLNNNEDIDVVSDRFEISEDAVKRIAESVESASYFESRRWGIIINGSQKRIFTLSRSCPECGMEFNELSPALFSFNSPAGACSSCHGFGKIADYDIDRVIPDKSLPIKKGAVAPWNTPVYAELYISLRREFVKRGIPFSSSFDELPQEGRKILIDGNKDFWGIKGFFKYLESKRYKLHIRVFLSKYKTYETCPECGGSRLKKDSLFVKISDRNIFEIQSMPVSDLNSFFNSDSFNNGSFTTGEVLLREIRSRIGYLLNVGLGYLSLDRQARTLSGGEMQRINLSKALGSLLTGTLYVLDEPTVGLHPRDTEKLKNVLAGLSRRGNTLVVVEHDESVIKMADHIIDLGPGAGEEGGEVVFEGSYEELRKESDSVTAEYIDMPPSLGRKQSTGKPETFIIVRGAKKNNIKEVDFRIPLGILSCITGVSGSGKSTFLKDIFYPALKKIKKGESPDRKYLYEIAGAEYIDNVILVDQLPPGKSARSNPVTYIKAYGEIRKVMAQCRQSQIAGVTETDFSFNAGNGRCPKCAGLGVERIEMQFLADLYVVCDECGGMRFTKKVLSVRYRGKNIAEILDMTVIEAIRFFSDFRMVVRKLSILTEMGLGYMRLGQRTSTLSGGEAQRLKLAGLLSEQKKNARYLFLFDEPTTGLHMADVENLVTVFRNMIKQGHSVLVIEHNPDFILNSDYIIDLGPEGGENGGKIVCEGSIDDIIACGRSYTGKYLAERINVSFNKTMGEENNEIL